MTTGKGDVRPRHKDLKFCFRIMYTVPRVHSKGTGDRTGKAHPEGPGRDAVDIRPKDTCATSCPFGKPWGCPTCLGKRSEW